MDQIYARIKRLRNNPFRRAVSGDKLFDFDVPDPGSCTEYDPNTLLDEDAWYKISDFRAKPYCLDVLKEDVVSADIPELAKDQFEIISYLMSIQSGNFLFQRVRPSSLLRRKSIVFGDVAALEKPSNRIIINPQPDAVFVSESNVLLFRDLASISPIFSGIDILYREATDDQVQEFLNNEFIATDLAPAAVSKPNRKRIALAMDTLSKMSEADRGSVFTYIGDYSDGKLEFDAQSGVFAVATDDELKTLVYGIEQRFYTTMVGSERRLANSIVKI